MLLINLDYECIFFLFIAVITHGAFAAPRVDQVAAADPVVPVTLDGLCDILPRLVHTREDYIALMDTNALARACLSQISVIRAWNRAHPEFDDDAVEDMTPDHRYKDYVKFKLFYLKDEISLWFENKEDIATFISLPSSKRFTKLRINCQRFEMPLALFM